MGVGLSGKLKFSVTEYTYVRGEHRVARRRLLHRDRQAESAGAQSAVLHQRDPLQPGRKGTRFLSRGETTEGAIKRGVCGKEC